jgi:hypothetical protein
MQLGKLTDEQARQYIEGILWPNGPVCPHCKSTIALGFTARFIGPA